jgi:hypothetical protein
VEAARPHLIPCLIPYSTSETTFHIRFYNPDWFQMIWVIPCWNTHLPGSASSKVEVTSDHVSFASNVCGKVTCMLCNLAIHVLVDRERRRGKQIVHRVNGQMVCFPFNDSLMSGQGLLDKS